MSTVTIPVYAAPVLPETLTLHVPDGFEDDVRGLGLYTIYGERYDRGIVDLLVSMSSAQRNGYDTVAARHLESALERANHKDNEVG